MNVVQRTGLVDALGHGLDPSAARVSQDSAQRCTDGLPIRTTPLLLLLGFLLKPSKRGRK